MNARLRHIIFGGLALLGVMLDFFFFSHQAHKEITAPDASSLPRCINADAENFSCYKKRLEKVTSQLGKSAGLQELHRLYDSNTYANSQCHQLAHVVGNVVANDVGDIADAFIEGDSLCWSGYYHGVVEAYVSLRGKDVFEKNADALCAKIGDKNAYGFNYYNCVHGLGHGVMAVTRNNLFEALTLCESLSPDWERRSCYGGVFMENIMTDNRNHYAPYLKPDDLLYPCNAVDEQYKEECYKMQTSYALTKNGYDFKGLFTLCLTAEEGYQHTCAQSVGRDASGQSTSDITRTISWCKLAHSTEQETDCYIGAVKDFVSYFHGDKEARALCFAVDQKFQSECERALLEQWRTINVSN